MLNGAVLTGRKENSLSLLIRNRLAALTEAPELINEFDWLHLSGVRLEREWVEGHVSVVPAAVLSLGVIPVHFLHRQPAMSVEESGVLHEA